MTGKISGHLPLCRSLNGTNPVTTAGADGKR
jgi:hypothetical protein